MTDSNAIIDDLIASGATEFGRDEVLQRLRYVPCEHCHGTGEIVHGIDPRHAYDEPSEYTTLCSACDGYGMECVETEPVTIDDIETDN